MIKQAAINFRCASTLARVFYTQSHISQHRNVTCHYDDKGHASFLKTTTAKRQPEAGMQLIPVVVLRPLHRGNVIHQQREACMFSLLWRLQDRLGLENYVSVYIKIGWTRCGIDAGCIAVSL
jgi:hypothetical protein